MNNLKYLFEGILLLFILNSCSNQNQALDSSIQFELIDPKSSGVNFINQLSEGPNTNVLMYEYFYNGGGVATGDFNQDGLMDLYFTSNMGINQLFINKGDFEFDNATDYAGISGRPGPWKTGATIVDINHDGKLDIYLCYSGSLPLDKRQNELYINQGNNEKGFPIFKEMAAQFGLNHPGFSNQAYFFDFDKDGDLDMLLLNHNPKSLPVLNVQETNQRMKLDEPLTGLRLFQQNENHFFQDVTTLKGINGTGLSYGLGVAIADFNHDGWLDFYLSNDYTIPDYLYINHQGNFTDELKNSLSQTSHFSMGNNAEDYDNDGFYDIFTLDMLPEDNERQKILMAPDNYHKFNLNIRSGFHKQYMRNMLQKNNGDGTFSEIGQLAGISNTDWSWAPLLGDFDNDGWSDLLITNGYVRDYTNKDFLAYMDNYIQTNSKINREDVLDLIAKMPASNVSNYLFKNTSDGLFKDISSASGIQSPSNSNGASLVDLDNDGDLDIVINNINQPASIYRNTSSKGNYLKIELKGPPQNTLGIGTEVILFAGEQKFTRQQIITKGYLSNISPTLHFGLNQLKEIDSLLVIWPNGKFQKLKPDVNQTIRLDFQDAQSLYSYNNKNPSNSLFIESKTTFQYQHQNPNTLDFDRQILLPYQPSFIGPKMVKGDINRDGKEDLILAGGYNHGAQVFVNLQGELKLLQILPPLSGLSQSDLKLVDLDKDDDLDLIIGSDGYANLPKEGAKQNLQVFRNQNGRFIPVSIPSVSGGITSLGIFDYNQDGKTDIFLAGGIIPGNYPKTFPDKILINRGDSFQLIIKEIPALAKGIIRDIKNQDFNQDGFQDLMIVGEWMSPCLLISHKNELILNENLFDQNLNGFFNTVELSDLNEDGKIDFVLGNEGLNSQLKVKNQQPIRIYIHDFDNNGVIDPVLTYFIQGKEYPLATRDELLNQMPYLKSKFPDYESFSKADIQEIFGLEALSKAEKWEVNQLASGVLLSGKEQYSFQNLPLDAQKSPVFAFKLLDLNKDNLLDLVLAGNKSNLALKLGQCDANKGVVLFNRGKGEFSSSSSYRKGLKLNGDVRDIEIIDNNWYFSTNQQALQIYRLKYKQ